MPASSLLQLACDMCVWLMDAVRSIACMIQIQLTFEEIRGLKKRTTAVLFDNAIEIYTFDTSYVFRSFLKRDHVRVSAPHCSACREDCDPIRVSCRMQICVLVLWVLPCSLSRYCFSCCGCWSGRVVGLFTGLRHTVPTAPV